MDSAFSTRQALRAAGAGQQAELHLRQPHLRAGPGCTGVAAQRQFQPAAQRDALDGGNHGHRHVLDGGDDLAQVGILHRAPELGDVGAAAERPRRASQHDCPQAGLPAQRVQRRHDALAQRQPQRVHRRVVHRDHGDVAVPLHRHRTIFSHV